MSIFPPELSRAIYNLIWPFCGGFALAGALTLVWAEPEFTFDPNLLLVARTLFGMGIAIVANTTTGYLSIGLLRNSSIVRSVTVLGCFLLGFLIAPTVFATVIPLTLHEASFSSTSELSRTSDFPGQIFGGPHSVINNSDDLVHINPKSPAASTTDEPSSGDCSPAVNGVGGSIEMSCRAPTATPEQKLSAIDVAISKLLSGNIAFNAPDRATIAKSVIIEARLSVTESPSVLVAELTGPGVSNTASIRVGDKMAATLNGSDAFTISPSGPQVQLISHKDTTTWTWTITPKQVGKQELILSIDAVLAIDGKEGNRTENTLRRVIDVRVGWPDTADEWIEYIKKTFEGVSWIWATILVPVVAYAIRLWSRGQSRQ